MKGYRKEELSGVQRGLRSGINWIVDILMVLILAVLVFRFYGDRTTMVGSSMKPVLESNDVVLVDELCYTFHTPKRCDVVSFVVETKIGETHYIFPRQSLKIAPLLFRFFAVSALPFAPRSRRIQVRMSSRAL